MTTQSLGGGAKHQACDECRRRKFKCTKEPEGCFRCLDYTVPCVYSPQRPMGRPRTRRHGQDINNDRACSKSTKVHEDAPKEVIAEKIVDSESLSYESLLHAAISTPSSGRPDQQREQGRIVLGFGGVCSIDHIDFSDKNEVPAIARKTPCTVSASGQPCFCVTRCCNAQEAMANLPSQFEDALRSTRQASRIVYEVLECPRCGIPPDGLTQSYQCRRIHTIIMAASIFPVLAAAYHKIENLADAEVAEADRNGRQLSFELRKYGGLWGPLSRGNRKCEEYYNDLTVDTHTWRSTIGALLRADVYGFDLPGKGEDCKASYHHRGLWDFVRAMKTMSTSFRHSDVECTKTAPEASSSVLQGGMGGSLEDYADLDFAIRMAHRSLAKLAI